MRPAPAEAAAAAAAPSAAPSLLRAHAGAPPEGLSVPLRAAAAAQGPLGRVYIHVQGALCGAGERGGLGGGGEPPGVHSDEAPVPTGNHRR